MVEIRQPNPRGVGLGLMDFAYPNIAVFGRINYGILMHFGYPVLDEHIATVLATRNSGLNHRKCEGHNQQDRGRNHQADLEDCHGDPCSTSDTYTSVGHQDYIHE